MGVSGHDIFKSFPGKLSIFLESYKCYTQHCRRVIHLNRIFLFCLCLAERLIGITVSGVCLSGCHTLVVVTLYFKSTAGNVCGPC